MPERSDGVREPPGVPSEPSDESSVCSGGGAPRALSQVSLSIAIDGGVALESDSACLGELQEVEIVSNGNHQLITDFFNVPKQNKKKVFFPRPLIIGDKPKLDPDPGRSNPKDVENLVLQFTCHLLF